MGEGGAPDGAQLLQGRGGQPGVVGVLVPDDPSGPVEQQPPVALGDAHHLGEGPDRQIGGELHEVGLAAPGHGVHERRRALLDDRFQLPYGARGEGRRDDAAAAGVVGRVLVEHHRPHELQIGGCVGVADLGGPEVGGEDLGGAQDVFDVGVPEHRPEAGAGQAPTAGSSIRQTGRVARNAPNRAYGTPAV
ncbi:hypothetical protein ACFQ10_45160 [Streptomyces indonesiensis]